VTCLGYARVSTEDQSLDIQREQLTAAGCKRIFEEKVSGKSTDVRDELQALLRFAVEGDTIIVTKLDRLARSTLDMLNIVTALGKRGVKFKSLAEPWANTDSPAAELMLTVMAGIAQFERGRIRERQLDGIAKAKLAGKYKGRQRKPITAERILELKKTMSMEKIGKELGAGRATLYRILEAATEPA
jgi:DNA invertase Pin-like site-specific DNA recombinase